MKFLDLEKIRAWVNDAVEFLPLGDEYDKISFLRKRAIADCSKISQMNMIALDTAEGISHLPSSLRKVADGALVARHGIGIDFFLEKKIRPLRKVLERGRILTEEEFRVVDGVISDADLSVPLSEALRLIINDYEKRIK